MQFCNPYPVQCAIKRRMIASTWAALSVGHRGMCQSIYRCRLTFCRYRLRRRRRRSCRLNRNGSGFESAKKQNSRFQRVLIRTLFDDKTWVSCCGHGNRLLWELPPQEWWLHGNVRMWGVLLVRFFLCRLMSRDMGWNAKLSFELWSDEKVAQERSLISANDLVVGWCVWVLANCIHDFSEEHLEEREEKTIRFKGLNLLPLFLIIILNS